MVDGESEDHDVLVLVCDLLAAGSFPDPGGVDRRLVVAAGRRVVRACGGAGPAGAAQHASGGGVGSAGRLIRLTG